MLWNFYSKLLLEFWQLSVLYRCKKNRLLIVLINICTTGVVKKPLAASNMHILNIIIWHEYLHYCFMGIFPDPDPNHFQESGVEGFRENRNPWNFFLNIFFSPLINKFYFNDAVRKCLCRVKCKLAFTLKISLTRELQNFTFLRSAETSLIFLNYS